MADTNTVTPLEIERTSTNESSPGADTSNNCTIAKSNVICVAIYIIVEVLLFALLFALSLGLSIVFAMLSDDISRGSLIAWFMFTYLILSFLIYSLCLICKRHRSSNKIKKFSIIRWTVFGVEFLLMFFTYQIVASMWLPNLTIFPDLYSQSISLDIPPYNDTLARCKQFFDCNLDFSPISVRDVSSSPMVAAYFDSIDFAAAAYVSRYTVHLVMPEYFSDALFVHELAHIWQFQNGRFSGVDGVNLLWHSLFNPVNYDMYDYGNLSNARINDKTFTEFGTEQQAEIIEDYFVYFNWSWPYSWLEDLTFYATHSVLLPC
eukprot:442743_1